MQTRVKLQTLSPFGKLGKFVLMMSLLSILMILYFVQNTDAKSNHQAISIYMDGQKLQIEDDLITLQDGRVFVPIRFVAEELEATVSWNQDQRKASIIKGSKQLDLWVDQNQYVFNGKTELMDVQPLQINGRIVVPVRFVADHLDVNVRWDSSERNVHLNRLGIHTVIQNESLFLISRALLTTPEQIIELNDLTTHMIYPGQLLHVPMVKYVQDTTVDQARQQVKMAGSSEDLEWLAKIIATEARGEPYRGQVAVGAVVLNRVHDENFPNTVYDVIFQVWEGYYQFEPVLNGEIHRVEPDATAYQAARDALNGEDPTNGALYFFNPSISSSEWMAAKPVSLRIGQHVFIQD